MIFDLIASEYGYTWRQFVGMTYKLLNACLEAISRRTHNKTAVLAAIHGIKLDLYKRPSALPPPPDETVLKTANHKIYKLLQRKQAAIKNAKR